MVALRSRAARLARQLGLVPAGEPDGRGEDESLRAASLPVEVLVYFAEPITNLYQLRQWYAAMEALDAHHRVGVVVLDSRVALQLRAETRLAVWCVARIATLEAMVSRSDVRLAMYVSHHPRNIHPLRFSSMLHCYLGHGESDKAASASNQVKAYDFALVAGPAGRDRLARSLLRYDAAERTRIVGRPTLRGPVAHPDGPPTVVYAPTWEGAQPSAQYGSVSSHGFAILTALLSTPDLRVVYRPHPRTGCNDPHYAEADRACRRLIEQAVAATPSRGHLIDTSTDWDPGAETAHLLVCDISAVATDWMLTDRPLIVTRPVSASAWIDPLGILTAAPTLAPGDDVVAVVRAELASAGDRAARQRWLEYAVGTETEPMQKFLTVCDELVALTLQERATRAVQVSDHE